MGIVNVLGLIDWSLFEPSIHSGKFAGVKMPNRCLMLVVLKPFNEAFSICPEKCRITYTVKVYNQYMTLQCSASHSPEISQLGSSFGLSGLSHTPRSEKGEIQFSMVDPASYTDSVAAIDKLLGTYDAQKQEDMTKFEDCGGGKYMLRFFLSFFP